MHECKFENLVIEMSGDIKTLVAEFKAMNGSLKDTKRKADKTEKVTIRHGVYWAVLIFVVISIIGVARLWMVTRVRHKQEISMAEGREGYRMSQMIWRDLNKKGEL